MTDKAKPPQPKPQRPPRQPDPNLVGYIERGQSPGKRKTTRKRGAKPS